MTSYHGDAERTAEAMADGYYRTGDIGSLDVDGYLTYVAGVTSLQVYWLLGFTIA